MAERILGVLGGMGPLASAQFMVRLTLLTAADRDQDHVPAILWSDVRLPDRAPSLLGHPGAADPLPYLRRGIDILKYAGCSAMVMPCNTAHGWSDLLEAEGLKLIHIVDACAADLPHIATVGIMGTVATLRLRLYQDRLERLGWRCIEPTEAETRDVMMPAIAAVKANRVAESYASTAGIVQALVARGAQAVILGCTELPISLQAGPRGEAEMLTQGVPVIDSIDALARAAIGWARGGAAAARAA